jgi:hypothetical protein
MPSTRHTPLALLFCLVCCPLLQAEEPGIEYHLPAGVSYDPAMPLPEDLFGFRVGAWHLRADQLAAYLQVLADRSPRMTLQVYAHSHQQKPLHFLIVTHPDNHARLDSIRARQAALVTAAGRAAAADDQPLVVWLGYNIHGGEASAANAVPIVAYHLAAAQGEAIERMLRDMVIIIDPCLNPDGLDRFAQHANMYRGANPNADPEHHEHREGWPPSRGNYYWFDINRDWLPLVHPESRGRMAWYHQWRPQVLADFHEMDRNRTHFFQPGVPARNNPLTPAANFDLTARIAGYNARALDAIGSLYYTRESFDDFYVGKGSTYPDLTGGVGLLFEQAGTRGRRVESAHGVLEFPFGIRNQVRSSLSTLEAAHALRADLRAYQRWFFESVDQLAAQAPERAFVFAASDNPDLLTKFAALLHRHAIAVHRLARDVQLNGVTFAAADALIVPLAQPQHRLIRSLFEQPVTFTENVFYDISTWALPPAFNLDSAAIPASHYNANMLGAAWTEPAPPPATINGGRSSYAYIFSWDTAYAPRALHRLQQAGIRTMLATRPTRLPVGGKPKVFHSGSIIVPVAGQTTSADAIHDLLANAAAADGIAVHALDTGLAMGGIDLGSPGSLPLVPARVAIAAGDTIVPQQAGEMWHQLDQYVGMAPTLLDPSRFGSVNLDRYTVLILPSGSYGTVNEAGVAALRRWIRGGGTLIALQAAARWAVDKDLAKATFKELPANGSAPGERLPYIEGPARDRLGRISGAIVEAHVDATHPLGYGYASGRVFLMRQGSLFLQPPANPYVTPVAYQAQPLTSGYINEDNLALLAGSPAVVISPLGAGRSILMLDNPVFRGYWWGGHKLLMNGIFFGAAMEY